MTSPLQAMRSIREQLEAGEVDGSTAEETRLHTVVDDKRTASFDGQAADISTPQKQADVAVSYTHLTLPTILRV